MAVGYIYILSNPAYADLLKIGFTCNAVDDRAVELSSTGVLHPFAVEFFQLTADVEEVERQVHAELQALRPNASREFFRVTVSQAVQAIEKCIRPPAQHFIREPVPTGALSECRRCGHAYPRDATRRFCPKCGF